MTLTMKYEVEKVPTLGERIKALEDAGWQYNADGRDWSSGSWWHDGYGSVNKGGGSFDHITEAVKRLERFLANCELIQN